MKYRVVGWTGYDDPDIEEAPCSEAAVQAIIADIRANGYLFTGWHHQEFLNCAPVLNDGKKRLFSEREFGEVMARAHGDLSRMGYAAYAFEWCLSSAETVMPDWRNGISSEELVPETALREEIRLTVPQEILVLAQANLYITLKDTSELTFLDTGDTLILCCEGENASYLVEGLERKKNLTEEDEERMRHFSRAEDSERAALEALYERAEWIVAVTLRPKMQ
ncbi:MAG: hypothetical protein IJW51_01910 [Clostridia bacterium]|nr:hypothetical protein [Clostridia bacterium]